MSLFDELKRRKVFRVGAAYLVVAWLAVQAASIGFPAFDAPPWVLRVFILFVLLGFPIAVVLAWVFESSSEGVRLDVTRGGSKRIFIAAAVLIVLAIGWYFLGQPSFRKGEAGAVATDPHSIAVLPFLNLTGKPDQDYFSDGMTEELLNELAKAPQLKVVARTSVFAFKNKGGDVREIGRKLGVAWIVEGSVRRDGNEVRVTAQLVRVADGIQVWSQDYDRKVESVFALQDDIAKHVDVAVQTSLGVTRTAAAAQIASRAPIDPAAYDEYLKGRELLRARKDMPGAIAHFKAALAKAPDFAAAWSSLSIAYETSFWYVKMTPAEQAAALAGQAQAAARAAALAPDVASSEHALGNVARAQFHYADAEQHYLHAMQLDPGYPDVREDYAEVLYEVGRFEDSRRAARELVKLDPYFLVNWNRVLLAAIALDRRDEVVEAVQRIRAIQPDYFTAKFGLLDYALAYNRLDEAHAAFAEMQKRWPADAALAKPSLPWVADQAGAATHDLSAATVHATSGTVEFALIARRDIGDYNAYFDRRGPIIQAYYFAELASSKPAGLAMLRDPRVKARLIRYGFPAYWREKGWPAACRPLGARDFECGMAAAHAR